MKSCHYIIKDAAVNRLFDDFFTEHKKTMLWRQTEDRKEFNDEIDESLATEQAIMLTPGIPNGFYHFAKRSACSVQWSQLPSACTPQDC
jgi:hypothetical protein